MINNISSTPLGEFINFISSIEASKPQEFFTEMQLFFRGVPDCSYDLKPGIYRKCIPWLLLNEGRMIDEAQRQKPDTFFIEKHPIDLLAKLQHFGMPTRLLDITSNAMVALYFACKSNINEKQKDGLVYIFTIKNDMVHSTQSPTVNIISSFYKMYGLTEIDFITFINMIKNDDFFKRFTSDVSEKEDFLNRIYERIKSPYFVLPTFLSERQKRQQGAFIIFPNDINKTDFNISINGNKMVTDLNNDKMNTCCKIEKYIIKGSDKEVILQQLKHLGITDSFLFPENINILCESICNDIEKLHEKYAK